MTEPIARPDKREFAVQIVFERDKGGEKLVQFGVVATVPQGGGFEVELDRLRKAAHKLVDDTVAQLMKVGWSTAKDGPKRWNEDGPIVEPPDDDTEDTEDDDESA